MLPLSVNIDAIRLTLQDLGLADQVDAEVFYQRLKEQVSRQPIICEPAVPYPAKGKVPSPPFSRVVATPLTLSPERRAQMRRMIEQTKADLGL